MSWHPNIRTSSNREAYSESHNFLVINKKLISGKLQRRGLLGFFSFPLKQLKIPITTTKKLKTKKT